MWRRRGFFRGLFLVLIFFSTGAAHAIRMQYPVGHTEALTGGTGMAALGGVAALVYNPASLGGVVDSQLSASGSTYFIIRSEMRSGGQVSGFNAVPNSVLTAWKLGDGAVSVGIVMPESYDFKMTMPIVVQGQTPTESELIAWGHRDRTLVGAAWGTRVLEDDACSTCGLYSGVSALGIYSSGKFMTGGIYAGPTSKSVSSTYSEFAMTAAVIAGGLIWKRSDWSLGLRLQLPSILLGIKQDGLLYVMSQTASNTPTTLRSTSTSTGDEIELWTGTLGAEWVVSEKLKILGDFWLGERQRGVGTNPTGRAPFGAGLAGRYTLASGYELIGGLRGDLGSLRVDDADQQEKNMSLSATLGVVWRRKDFESAFGVFNNWTVNFNTPEAIRNNPYSNNPDGELFAGVTLSGLYHF